MSNIATHWAWAKIRGSGLPSTRRLVLLAIAERHNGVSGRCNPSLNTLIRDTGLDRNVIPAAIRDLEESGLISVRRRHGAGSHYRFIGLETGAQNGTGTETHTSMENPTSMEFPTGMEKPTATGMENPTATSMEFPTRTGNGTRNRTGKDVCTDSRDPHSENRGDETQEPKPTKPKRNRSSKTALPDDFRISDSVREWYAKQGYAEPLESHFEAFCDKARSKGYAYADWTAAFRNAIRDDWAGLRNKKAPVTDRSPGRSETVVEGNYARQQAQKNPAGRSHTSSGLEDDPWAGVKRI
jgi:hypothetical protein